METYSSPKGGDRNNESIANINDQEVKQLIELMFDVEAQIVRADQIGTKYGGQSGTAGGVTGAAQTGRRFGS